MEDAFYKAWQYLLRHPYFADKYNRPRFKQALMVYVVKMSPRSGNIEEDPKRNTTTQVWLECGPYDDRTDNFKHDIRLDCGADSFENGIINLSNLVKKYIGDKYERTK